MNRLDTTITGGIQFFEEDIAWMQDSYRGALHNIYEKFAVGANKNFIIAGCIATITPSVSCSVTAGYIWLNGEMIKVDAHVATYVSSDVYAYTKVTTADATGNRTIKKTGGTAIPWQKDRGVCTDVGSVTSVMLDVEGPTIANKMTTTIPYATTTTDGVVELATSAEVIAGASTTHVVTPAGLQAKVASTTSKGISELATGAETVTGTDTVRTVTPAGIQSKAASSAETITGSITNKFVTPAGLQAKVTSTTVLGLVELATSAETITGSDTTRAVTPAAVQAKGASSAETITGSITNKFVTPGGLQTKVASTTAKGILELATNAETETGTDTTRAITPAALAYMTDKLFQNEISIGDWDMDATGSINVAFPGGVAVTDFRFVSAIIKDDSNTFYHQLTDAGRIVADSSGPYFTLIRDPGSIFDSISYDSTGYNRGFIYIVHV